MSGCYPFPLNKAHTHNRGNNVMIGMTQVSPLSRNCGVGEGYSLGGVER